MNSYSSYTFSPFKLHRYKLCVSVADDTESAEFMILILKVLPLFKNQLKMSRQMLLRYFNIYNMIKEKVYNTTFNFYVIINVIIMD